MPGVRGYGRAPAIATRSSTGMTHLPLARRVLELA